MEPKQEDQPAEALPLNYQPLPDGYEPYEPTEKQKRSLERLLRKKRT